MTAIDLRPDNKKLRHFGICGLVGLGALGMLARFLWGTPSLAVAFWIMAAFCLLAGLATPRALWPLYVVLTLLAYPIGFVISHLALGLLFYGIFAPIGLVFRVMGRDALHRQWRPERESYWSKSGPSRTPEDYYRQF